MSPFPFCMIVIKRLDHRGIRNRIHLLAFDSINLQDCSRFPKNYLNFNFLNFTRRIFNFSIIDNYSILSHKINFYSINIFFNLFDIDNFFRFVYHNFLHINFHRGKFWIRLYTWSILNIQQYLSPWHHIIRSSLNNFRSSDAHVWISTSFGELNFKVSHCLYRWVNWHRIWRYV